MEPEPKRQALDWIDTMYRGFSILVYVTLGAQSEEDFALAEAMGRMTCLQCYCAPTKELAAWAEATCKVALNPKDTTVASRLYDAMVDKLNRQS